MRTHRRGEVWSTGLLQTFFVVTIDTQIPVITEKTLETCGLMDLHIDHDRFGSISDPSLNGHLHYPNDIDKSLNETVTTDVVRKETREKTLDVGDDDRERLGYSDDRSTGC